MNTTLTSYTATVYGLENIEVRLSPYGHRLYSCDSIRAAIDAIPADEQDAWYLPDTEGSWAYRNGRINYQFCDEYGDTDANPFYCGNCAESIIRSGHATGEYVFGSIYSSEEADTCEVCGEEVSN